MLAALVPEGIRNYLDSARTAIADQIRPDPRPVPLPELLQKHDLPPGLFPKNITGYNFDKNTGKITVNMPYVCDVRGDSSALRLSNTVTGCLERGKLSQINGMLMESLTREQVRCIEVEIKQSRKGKIKKLHFTGKVDQVKPFDEYTTLKDGIPF